MTSTGTGIVVYPQSLTRQPPGACRHCNAMPGDPAAATFFESLADADVAALKRLIKCIVVSGKEFYRPMIQELMCFV